MVVSDVSELKKLVGDQLPASDPDKLVWLSASAGTGKTQVLAARVLRLLLSSDNFRPETILCLTFTKAGASEMAGRINRLLARWVMAPGTAVGRDLTMLGERCDPPTIARARKLFARVLDARGGGLRIQTIHSFCQSLLGSFPAEAGLTPGFTLIDPREEAALPRQILARMTVDSEASGQLGFINRLQQLAYRFSEDQLQSLLTRHAKVPDVMETLPPYDGLRAMLRRRLCNGVEDVETRIETICTDPMLIRLELDDFVARNMEWGTKTGMKHCERIGNWLARTPAVRAATLADLELAWLTGERQLRKDMPKDEAARTLREVLHKWCNTMAEMQTSARTADEFALMLSVGRDFSAAYQQEKRARGLVDYDDLIRKTAALLDQPDIGEWIRYKLDQATDHILIDEAQDTNQRQWAIIKSITSDFFAGSGAKGDVFRTLFAVGDYKQAIFRFQGTDPRHFAQAHRDFDVAASGVGRDLLSLSLNQSFRSSPPVLDVVDAVLSEIGAAAIGLDGLPDRHESARGGGGAVILMPPVTDMATEGDGGDEGGDGDYAPEGDDDTGHVPNSGRKLANEIAAQVKSWLDQRLWLESQGRPIEPQDVLILVRKRGQLAALIVARLHEAGIRVAGVDRLRLGLPLAVKDLLACLRFALQPLDDLNVAALLVSPLIGWTEDELFAAAHGRGGQALWPHLRKAIDAERLAPLYALLGAADMATPYQFLETILSGSMQGRRKLMAQLGAQASDPINELLNAALEFARSHPPSLQPFLDWFDRGDIEIKREPSSAATDVRVMTVHGAKGLQAPVVILADATGKPKLPIGGSPLDWDPGDGQSLPLVRPAKGGLIGDLKLAAQAEADAELREHWRLLYVALTRAEERLVITGALNPSDKGVVPEGSWYQAVDAAMMRMGISAVDGIKSHSVAGKINPRKQIAARAAEPLLRPDWLDRLAPPEARPPRPLAPSALAHDDVADPPPNPQMAAAAQRGRLLHALFERLPAVPADQRRQAAERWLADSAGIDDAATRAELCATVISVMETDAFAPLFATEALAEAPIAGIVDGVVVAGTVDRLVITDDAVLVIDFKTGRRVPTSPEACPVPHLRQMAAYHALLASIFPERQVSAALLYSAGPRLHRLPEALLAQHKPGLFVQ